LLQSMTDSSPGTYQVTLPVFEGPLDLLLHLIEREELDITQVSLAQVTNQYLEYLAAISERDPDSLADFLVVAAKLLLIKSRVLLPQQPGPLSSSDEGDVGEDLVRQLLEYKKYKEAAGWFKEIEAQGLTSYVRLAAAPSLDRVVDLGEVSLEDLLETVRQVLAIKPPAPSVNGTVPPISITIEDQISLIERRTKKGERVSFRGLLEKATSRVEIIVTLLALLEMVKQLRVTMQQGQRFGDVSIVAREPAKTASSTDPSATPGS
jgi:segregation and condensation protein A